MSKLIWQHILISTITVIVIGGFIFRLMPGNWLAMVHDVGESGAWVVQLFFHILYSFFIVIGVLVSIHTIKNLGNKPKLYISFISSGGTIAIWYAISSFHFFRTINFFVLGICFIFSTYILSLLLFSIDKNLTQRCSCRDKSESLG